MGTEAQHYGSAFYLLSYIALVCFPIYKMDTAACAQGFDGAQQESFRKGWHGIWDSLTSPESGDFDVFTN